MMGTDDEEILCVDVCVCVCYVCVCVCYSDIVQVKKSGIIK